MEFLIVLGLIFGGAIVWGMVSGIDAKEKAEERALTLDDKLDALINFTPTHQVKGVLNMYIFAVDHNRRKVVYIDEEQETIFSYDEIMSVEITENNTAVASKSSARTIGGAVVGGALAGGAGAVVGGLSGDTTMKKKVSKLQVRIKLRDINNPVLIINCFDSKSMLGMDEVKSDSISGLHYKEGLEHAQQISDLVGVIIDDVDRAEKQKNISKSVVSSGSVAEELSKLAELRDKGILTDDEFKEQKSKLLNL